jgi:hypothetical protein
MGYSETGVCVCVCVGAGVKPFSLFIRMVKEGLSDDVVFDSWSFPNCP